MISDIFTDRIAGPKSPTNMQLGYLIMRLMLGLNLFLHGSMRLLAGIDIWLIPTAETFVGTILPQPLVVALLHIIPIAELMLGALLLLGLSTRSALLGSILLFLLLDFGHGVRQLWSNMHLVMHYSIYFWILLVLHKQNWLALDNEISARKQA